MRIMKVLAAALSLSACAMAQPTSHAEWRGIDGTHRQRPSWPHPPVNLTPDGHLELFRDAVFVHDMWGYPPVQVQFYGRDGRYLRCNTDDDGYFWRENTWKPVVEARRNGVTPLLHAPGGGAEGHPRLGHLYDGHTGELASFTEWRRRWWDWQTGHLQRRLPAAVRDLCPGFPSAEELGIGINHAQTALSYDELVAQDPGDRILRPDLMAPDAVRPYE